MNKIKIGSSEFELSNYYQSTVGERPSWTFDIKATYGEVKPLITDNQTYIVSSTSETDETSERDLTYECVIFENIVDNNTICTLTMSNYSTIELLKQTVDVFGVSGLKQAYTKGQLTIIIIKRLLDLGVITKEQYEEITG